MVQDSGCAAAALSNPILQYLLIYGRMVGETGGSTLWQDTVLTRAIKAKKLRFCSGFWVELAS